jgi:hypothetical protein
VTPEEIRATQLTIVKRDTDDGPFEYAVDLNLRKFEMLREIAAQLAEHNQQLRDDRMGETLEVEGKIVSLNGVRVEYPGSVQHLACLVREPDGALKLATNTGQLIELDAADTARIVSLMSPPAETEAKPS